ncbi:MAG: phosphoribosyltransferase family protein [Candidatus Nanoarchaeia archaeon]|nr:phosphoribosyltransferase family protein [Candidatus Nanoarchaeia archaeon]
MELDNNIPGWFDMNLLPLYEKKRDRTSISKRDRSLDAILRGLLKCVPCEISRVNTRYHSWIDIEQMIKQACVGIQEDSYAPSLIMGIKSGGAFIARYAAICLEVNDVDYMGVSHYSGKTRSVARSLTQVNKNAVVTEKNTMPVEGKAILLVDDQAATGSSLIAGKDYLLKSGASEVRTMCLFSKKKPLADYYAKRGLAVYFPWGKDA